MRVYHLSSLNLRSIKVDSRLHRYLAFIVEHQWRVGITDLTDVMLKGWIAGDLTECLPEVTAARYAAPILFAFTPDDLLIPVKVFIYTYEHYCRYESASRHWLDEWAELRFVQFQYLLRLIRLACDTGQAFPSFNLFDYGNYDQLVDEAASIDRDGRFRKLISVISPRIDAYHKPS